MKKDAFLKKLEESLSKLSDEDRKKVLRKYKSTFTRKMNKGMTEEEIIDEFGNYNDLVKKILLDYGIDTPAQESASTIADFFKDFVKVIEDIVVYVSKQDVKDIVMLVLKLLVTLIIISLLKLPILLLRDLGSGVFGLLFMPLSTVLIFCWRFLLEISYVIIAITVFIKVFNIIIKPSMKKQKK